MISKLTFQGVISSVVTEIDIGGGVACYIRQGLCFNTRPLNSKEIEDIIFDILLPKPKLITIGVFYRPPNQANFMELIVKNFSLLNPKDNEIYLLDDFSINRLQNGNYIRNRKGMAACEEPGLTRTFL